MLLLAVDALGADRVTAVVMPSRYSSEGTQSDARALAANLGVQCLDLPIAPAMDVYEELLAPVFGDREPDITEENLQARIRGNLLMALSNKFGWLVLTTGNKSENSVGYSTLYGDSAGGFAVIKDVPKTLVYRLVDWRDARDGERPVPRSIVDRPPSAELRPDQKDADSLPDYDTLDAILEAYIEEDAGREQLALAGLPEDAVARVFALVDRAEYKRRQAPPGVKITPRAFGRDRRMPITNAYREGRPDGGRRPHGRGRDAFRGSVCQPLLQRRQHLRVEEVPQADPGDAQLGEPGEVRCAGPQQDVDGDPGGHERLDRGLVGDADRVDAVGARRGVGAGALERLSGPAAAQVDVDARVQDEVGAGLDGGDPLRMCGGGDERGRMRVVAVLEVEPDGAGRGEALGQLAAGEAVAGLHVGGHGHADRAYDAGDGRQHLLDRRLLAVLVAERLGHAAAGGGHGRQARGLDDLRGRGVPGVGEDERIARDVQGAQRRRAHAASGSYSPACSCPAMATRFQALMVTMIQTADASPSGPSCASASATTSSGSGWPASSVSASVSASAARSAGEKNGASCQVETANSRWSVSPCALASFVCMSTQ